MKLFVFMLVAGLRLILALPQATDEQATDEPDSANDTVPPNSMWPV